jgi:hypothetical protein
MTVRKIGSGSSAPTEYVRVAGGSISSPTQFMSVSNIPQLFRDLKIVISNAAQSGVSSDSYPQFYMNGSFANFNYTTLAMWNGTYYPYTPAANPAAFYMGGGAPALKAGVSLPKAAYEISVLGYSSSTKTKNGFYYGAGQSSGGLVHMNIGAFHWANTAAVTSLGFYAYDNWAVGTTIDIYGIGVA